MHLLPLFLKFTFLVNNLKFWNFEFFFIWKENATNKAKEDAILTFFKAKVANFDLDNWERLWSREVEQFATAYTNYGANANRI